MKIIKPEGQELLDYVNNGYPICNQCGALMYHKKDTKGGCDILVCPACGWKIDELEYEYDNGDPYETVEDDRGNPVLILKNDMPPAGCKVCGGPYPECKADCKMFND